MTVDLWVLLHLETLLAPQHYLLPEEVKQLKWFDTPEKVHVRPVASNLSPGPQAATGHILLNSSVLLPCHT